MIRKFKDSTDSGGDMPYIQILFGNVPQQNGAAPRQNGSASWENDFVPGENDFAPVRNGSVPQSRLKASLSD
jgi:hypothetical protein